MGNAVLEMLFILGTATSMFVAAMVFLAYVGAPQKTDSKEDKKTD